MTQLSYIDMFDYILAHRLEIRLQASQGSTVAQALIDAFNAYQRSHEDSDMVDYEDRLRQALIVYQEAKK